MNKLLMIGLGNPGKKFEGTRHNLGIQVVRAWFDSQRQGGRDVSDWRQNDRWPAWIAKVRVEGQFEVVCFFPTTFMNASGQAVRKFVQTTAIETSQIIVVHDDIELPLGQVDAKDGGSAAGHKGVCSIHEALETREVRRLRLGIGRPPENVGVDVFVLDAFARDEEDAISEMESKAVDALSGLVRS